jgi:hypothetical protein
LAILRYPAAQVELKEYRERNSVLLGEMAVLSAAIEELRASQQRDVGRIARVSGIEASNVCVLSIFN